MLNTRVHRDLTVSATALPSLAFPERVSEGIAERPQLVGHRGSEKRVVVSLDIRAERSLAGGVKSAARRLEAGPPFWKLVARSLRTTRSMFGGVSSSTFASLPRVVAP
jgi:hypothetical protein